MTSTRGSRMRLLETRDDPVPVSIQRERLLAITVGQSAAPETEPESQATPKASRVSLWESLAWRGRFFVGVLALLQIYMFVTMALVVVLSTIAFGWTWFPGSGGHWRRGWPVTPSSTGTLRAADKR